MKTPTIEYDFSKKPWVIATCSECGSFTAGVHEENLELLEQEAREHLREEHGEQT